MKKKVSKLQVIKVMLCIVLALRYTHIYDDFRYMGRKFEYFKKWAKWKYIDYHYPDWISEWFKP